MKALFAPDLDTIADEEDAAEFRRSFAALSRDHRRILMVLIPKLAALQERGDSAAALALIAEVRRAIGNGDKPMH